MKRKTSRTPWRRPPTPPVRPPVIPKPPAPSIPAPAEDRRRRRRRRAPTPAEQIAQAIEVTTAEEPTRTLYGVPIGAVPEPAALPGALYYSRGTMRGPWAPGELGRRPAIPALTPAAELAAKYGGEPTELWFLREDLGGRAGRAGEIWKAWAGGGRPLFVPKSAAEILGVHEDQMKEAGYGRTLGGSWQLEDAPRPDLQPPPSYGGSYGYTPSRYGYGGGGVRGQAAARGAGLVNWRIRIG